MATLLRLWVGVTAAAAIFAAGAGYTNIAVVKERQFAAQPDEVTALAARLWGTWTGLASLIRLSFAYSPREPTLYTLTILSYVVAGGFYTYETFVTHTIKLDQWPTYAPFIVSSGSILWLLAMRSSILGGGSSGKAKRN
jgi:hypothetical protein